MNQDTDEPVTPQSLALSAIDLSPYVSSFDWGYERGDSDRKAVWGG